MADLFSARYNPDVLSCIANLSNDEVFTPPEVANAMLDMLPQELFESPDTKFLDPACKSGVFLREITKRLLKGLESKIPDKQERIDHILHNQVYGIAITEMTSLLARRSLYCSKYPNCKYSVSQFDNIQGNVRFKNTPHRFKDGKCVFCSGSEKVYGTVVREGLEYHAYEFIHTIFPEEIWKMKFDVIIGNPPYQLSDGGAGASAMPIYNRFVEQAIKLQPKYLTMIIPSRWFAGGRALDKFRESMLNDNHIKSLVDYQQSKDCFPGVDIAGGVCYFLRDCQYSGDCEITNASSDCMNTEIRPLNSYNVFVRNNIGFNIVQKVQTADFVSLNTIMANYNPFLIRSFVQGENKPFNNSVTLISSKGTSYIDKSIITKNQELIGKYKVTVSKVTSEHAGESDRNGQYRVLSSLRIMEPGVVCSESYVVIGAFDSKDEAKMLFNYLKTKLIRFLILQAATSINLTQDTFMFVPLLNMNDKNICQDVFLYEKYGLTQEEINLIENMIKPMELSDSNDE